MLTPCFTTEQYLNLSNYSSRQASFFATPSSSGPSATSPLGHSFPRPDVDSQDESDHDELDENGQRTESGREAIGGGIEEEPTEILPVSRKPAFKRLSRPEQRTASAGYAFL